MEFGLPQSEFVLWQMEFALPQNKLDLGQMEFATSQQRHEPKPCEHRVRCQSLPLNLSTLQLGQSTLKSCFLRFAFHVESKKISPLIAFYPSTLITFDNGENSMAQFPVSESAGRNAPNRSLCKYRGSPVIWNASAMATIPSNWIGKRPKKVAKWRFTTSNGASCPTARGCW